MGGIYSHSPSDLSNSKAFLFAGGDEGKSLFIVKNQKKETVMGVEESEMSLRDYRSLKESENYEIEEVTVEEFVNRVTGGEE